MQSLFLFISNIASFITTFSSLFLAFIIAYLGGVRLGMEMQVGYLIATFCPLFLCFVSISAFLFKTGLYIPGAIKRDIPLPDASEILELWPRALWFIAFCLIFGFILIICQRALGEDN